MEIVDFKIVTYERLQTVLSVNMRAGSFPLFLVLLWMLVSQNSPQERKDRNTLKYPFSQSCWRALGKELLTSFSREQSDGHFVMA